MNVKELMTATNTILKEEFEQSGMLEYSEDIYATYYLDKDYIKSIQVFATARVSVELDVQVQHSIDLISFIQKIIMSLCEMDLEEANNLLTVLGFYDQRFAGGTQTFVYDYLFKAEAKDGLILFTASEL